MARSQAIKGKILDALLPRLWDGLHSARSGSWIVFTLLAAIALSSSAVEPEKKGGTIPAPAAADFQKDVEPIFAQHCYSCHGPEKQKSGLRLDRQLDALAGGDSGKVIIPGHGAESKLIRYVAGIDPDMIMPPKGERLSAEQIATLRAWIDSGAHWPNSIAVASGGKLDHWAFKAPQLPARPHIKRTGWARNPIDTFVLARLEKEGIDPSPEAPRVTLIRRLSFDLTGLPPSVEEVERFLKDSPPDAYERLVDRLLASPHFGEQWGRHWLDMARYADSDGYEKDGPRPYAYLYRDWVIDAINHDLPFDQFTIDQLAGDLLPGVTEKQKIATGFHRQTLTNREGGVDKEEFRCKATVDRASTTATAWLGLTLGCAECHSHKYDPITQREFYQFYAFFNNASGKDISAPQPAEMAEYTQQLKTWEAKLARLQPALQAYLTNVLETKIPDWERGLTLPSARWTALKPNRIAIATEGDETLLTAGKDYSISPRPKDPVRSRFTIETEVNLKGITAFRVEALSDPGKSVGRGTKGDFALSEFTVSVHDAAGEPRKLEIVSAKADFAATNSKASDAIDGDRATGWGVAPQTSQSHVIVFELKEPLNLTGSSKLTFQIDQFTVGLLNRFRLAATTSAVPVAPNTTPDAVVAILDTQPQKRTEKQRLALARYFVEHVDADGMRLHKEIAAHQAKKPKYPETIAAIMIADERKTHVHIRGDFLRKGDEVQPGTPAVLPPLQPRGATADRLDLARWLVDPANPLTARVAVNHVWKNLFGRALVASLNDFGTRGEKPSHPELLDWLALAFSSSPARGLTSDAPPSLNWSRKALIKLIVCSAAYRQSSIARRDLLERDPSNILLARQNRVRLEAENVRDAYLAAAGLLNPSIGGPSIRPPLPADIAALGYANSVKWTESKGPEKYRRGMYIFFQRTVPYPMLVTFDAPDSNTSCTRREHSNTPLQALTQLNDPVFFECAQSLAQRLSAEISPQQNPGSDNLHSTSASLTQKIRYAFRYCVSREATDPEILRLTQLYSAQRRLLEDHLENAIQLSGEKGMDESIIKERATLVALCRVIMNLDEFVTRD